MRPHLPSQAETLLPAKQSTRVTPEKNVARKIFFKEDCRESSSAKRSEQPFDCSPTLPNEVTNNANDCEMEPTQSTINLSSVAQSEKKKSLLPLTSDVQSAQSTIPYMLSTDLSSIAPSEENESLLSLLSDETSMLSSSFNNAFVEEQDLTNVLDVEEAPLLIKIRVVTEASVHICTYAKRMHDMQVSAYFMQNLYGACIFYAR